MTPEPVENENWL